MRDGFQFHNLVLKQRLFVVVPRKSLKNGNYMTKQDSQSTKKKLCNSVYISRDFHRSSKYKGFNFKHDSESKCDK